MSSYPPATTEVIPAPGPTPDGPWFDTSDQCLAQHDPALSGQVGPVHWTADSSTSYPDLYHPGMHGDLYAPGMLVGSGDGIPALELPGDLSSYPGIDQTTSGDIFDPHSADFWGGPVLGAQYQVDRSNY